MNCVLELFSWFGFTLIVMVTIFSLALSVQEVCRFVKKCWLALHHNREIKSDRAEHKEG
jgi:hypothetical protein